MNKDLCKYIYILEFDKILDLLKEQAVCSGAQKMIENLRPSNSRSNVLRDLRQTDDAYKLINSFSVPTISFVSDSDMFSIVNKARVCAQMTTKELRLISDFLGNIFGIVKWKKQSQDRKTSLDYLFDEMILLKELKSKIDDIVLSEDEIADSASEDLMIIRNKLNKNLDKIKESLEELIKSATYQKCLQEPIITIREGRFVVPVKSEHRAEIKGLVHDTSASGATLFVEPISVVQANNEIKILQRQEKEEINKILDMLSEQVRLNIDSIIKNYDILIKLDFCFAKAKLGLKMNAVIPKINDNQQINLIKARHPLIDAKRVVPVDVQLGNSFNSLIITGPNTGGKTVVLKTVGLFTVMAMSGLMIPAQEGSETCVFDKILADIGDEQSIQQSLSTFSSHMTNIINILENADQNSLVLIDELGAGTDPVEGANLAIAILEELREKNSRVVATTHYSELKIYASNTPEVENASCEFDVESLKPTYKLLIGIPGRSNAFLISQKLGLGGHILRKAKLLMGEDRNNFERTVSKLEDSREKFEKQSEELELLKQEVKKERDHATEIRKQLEKNKEHEIEKLKNKVSKTISQVEATSKEVFEELSEILKQKNNENFSKMVENLRFSIKSKTKKMNGYYSSYTNGAFGQHANQDFVVNQSKKIEEGDRVKILSLNQFGVALKGQDKSGFCLVQMGMLKNKVHISDLVAVESKNNQNNNKNNSQEHKHKSTRSACLSKISSSNLSYKKFGDKIESELSLRGKTVEEALMDLDKFIDDAVVLGLFTVRIIHGKGTGTLRAAVSDFLRSDGRVKSFRLGVYGEGEDGVTIASLK